MKGKLAVMLAVVIVFLATSASVFAHHGNVAYDMKDLVALKNATVTKFFWANPHNILTFDIKDDNGNVVHWVGETGSPAAVGPFGWTRDVVHPGEVVTVYIFRAKAGTPVGIINKIVLADGREFKDVPLGGTDAEREEAKRKGIE
ncbi:MAG: hypothetical protein DMG31_15500 [Acidobacteria bacterium]|nr:MAG: hypothetical protein DMG31_15500 [Acidobacteriota bacterium]